MQDPTPEPTAIRRYKKQIESSLANQAALAEQLTSAKPSSFRGSRAIGQNVDVENIRSSTHRENFLGHSILARESN